MSLAQPLQPHYTVANYYRIEADTTERHEYRDGEILAMSDVSPNHSLIIANLIREAGNRLKGKPCRVYDSNLRVRIPSVGRLTYPDVTIVCGRPEFDPQDPRQETVINPRLLIEVLSPSTESRDRGEKFDFYRMLASMQEYVLVYALQPKIEAFFRQPDGGWLFNLFTGLEAAATLRSVDVSIPLADVYADVEFPPAALPGGEDPGFKRAAYVSPSFRK